MTNRLFPQSGRSWDEVKVQMETLRRDDLPWHHARIFKPAYYAGDDLVRVANAAYDMYISDNALYGGTSYPSIGRYETEVVAMLLELLDAPEGAGGSVTAGGTESNMMAVKAARDWARVRRPGARDPEMLLPRSAHPSFDKAAHMFGVKPVRMAESPNFRADVNAMEKAINENTIMLVGSAPPYPYGTTDPIDALSVLAARHDLWLHVDSCIGGFILPFARQLGYSIPAFEFSLPGVTSISVDVHKFGYANKGISVLLLRDKALEAYQRTTFDAWPSGLYSTPNITGSRSGGAIASAWAVMNYLGRDGYKERVRAILAIRDRIIEGIRSVPGLEVWGEPHAYNFSFGSRRIDIDAVADGLADRDWLVGRALEPPSIQLMVNMGHKDIVDAFIADLGAAVRDVEAGRRKSRGEKAVYAI
ncbi:MAG: aspartate aminotransferase family protein [Alphaproteobacteria bacterium]